MEYIVSVERKKDAEELERLYCTHEFIRCRDCKNSIHWYNDVRRCYLWGETGVSVFDDGFCHYAEKRKQ